MNEPQTPAQQAAGQEAVPGPRPDARTEAAGQPPSGSETDVVATIGAEPTPAHAPVHPPQHGLNLWTVLVAVAGVLVIWRLYSKLRAASKISRKDWDEQEIERLRKQGYVPFREYPVDFFLALPDMEACEGVRALLEPQGYSVDIKPIADDASLHYSLHALANMKLLVPEMEEKTKGLTKLAEQFHGRYDGWSASGDISGVVMRARRSGPPQH